MFAVERWCFTTCAFFMLCPRRYVIDATPPYHWTNSNKMSMSKSFNLHGTSFVPRRFLNVVRDNGSISTLEEAEPGFNFNDEEMKKLKIWPGGAIPYYIDQFSFDKVFRDRLRTFLDMTNSVTGLNFLELHRPPDDDVTRWVLFVNRQGLLSCADHPYKNFTSEGVQKIILGYDCLSAGGELAEMVLSLVGVPPQHNAPDRNKYIKIEKENIMPGKINLFDILKDNEWLFHGVEYDFASAGHYSLHKYTVNGKATIKPLSYQAISIGEGKGFSYTDIWKIRMIYNYISKKRLKSVNIPECNKLFELGDNLSNNLHESEDDVQPRKKPNKYLGLPEEAKDDKNETPSKNKDVDKKYNIGEENLGKPKDIKSEDEKSNDTKPKPKPKPNNLSESKEDSKKVVKKIDEKNPNPISDEPDFSTDVDETKEKNKELKFTRPGGR